MLPRTQLTGRVDSLDDVDDIAHLCLWADQHFSVSCLWAVESAVLALIQVAKYVADTAIKEAMARRNSPCPEVDEADLTCSRSYDTTASRGSAYDQARSGIWQFMQCYFSFLQLPVFLLASYQYAWRLE